MLPTALNMNHDDDHGIRITPGGDFLQALRELAPTPQEQAAQMKRVQQFRQTIADQIVEICNHDAESNQEWWDEQPSVTKEAGFPTDTFVRACPSEVIDLLLANRLKRLRREEIRRFLEEQP